MIVNLSEAKAIGGLRALRAVRTPTVLRGKRATTYSTGLAQAEELWDAAGTISPLASPILRYYALAQASRAVVASSELGNQEWEPKGAHGLKLVADNRARALEDVGIEQDGDGLAQKVAMALKCPLLKEQASMAELIAALPGQSLFPGNGDHPPRALSCELGMHGSKPETDGILLSLELPTALLPISWPDGSDEITALLEMYPTLKGGPRPVKLGIVPDVYGQPSHLELGFDKDIRYMHEVERIVDIWVSPLKHASDADNVSGWVLPSIGHNTAAQHPLVTWLLVLFGLSMLARYHPVTWRHMLNVDENSQAVPIERLIERDSALSMSFVELAIQEFMRSASAAT